MLEFSHMSSYVYVVHLHLINTKLQSALVNQIANVMPWTLYNINIMIMTE